MAELLTMPLDTRTPLLSDDWFRGCPTALQDALIAHARRTRLAPGEHLFLRGTRDFDLYCVLSGSLCVQSAGVEGEMPVLVVLEPCHWFGELSFIDQIPRSHDAVADTEVTLLRVPHAGLQDWLARHPVHWRDIARLATGKLRIAYRLMDEEMRRPLAERVGQRLWLVAHGWGHRTTEPHRRIRLSQDQLARMLGTSRSGVNKVLRDLEQQGLIRLRYGEIELLRLAELRHGSAAAAVAA